MDVTELVGQHVRVLPMRMEHVEPLFEAGKYPEIWSYMPTKVATLNDMRDVVRSAVEARNDDLEIPFVIEDLATHQLVGSTRLFDISTANRSLEIGWTWLTPSVWRTRVNAETKYLLLRHCFDTLGLMRVQLKTDARNARSQQAIERIGGVREGVLRKHRILSDGYIRDSVYYSILDDEWPSVRTRLEARLQYERQDRLPRK